MTETIYNYVDFEYVVEQKKPTKLCFASTSERNTSLVGKVQYLAGPQTYDLSRTTTANRILNKVRSNRGVPGLANGKPRITFEVPNRAPPPGQYEIGGYKPVTQSCAPFNVKVKRKSLTPKVGPSPAQYNVVNINLCKRTQFQYNFGHPCMVPAVEYFCKQYILDKCIKCSELLEKDDYWHKNYITFLCQLCMAEEHILHEHYDETQLLQFKKIRNCSFMHRHEDTSAAIRLLPPRLIKKKIRLENYLELYLKCHKNLSICTLY